MERQNLLRKFRLNPCFNGILKYEQEAEAERAIAAVLILVLMEY